MKSFIVYVWMITAYSGDPIIVGEFENCDQGVATANSFYPDYVALHCITPDLTPPGGIKQ
jgi:hypothetical protein